MKLVYYFWAMKNCLICNEELDGNKIKYCSNNCKSKGHYRDKKNTNTYHSQTIRGLRRKLKLMSMKGSKCQVCSYNKNVASLEFNHKLDKKFPLDVRNLSNRKWSDLVKEVEKCDLLCANCHREYHNPELTFYNIEKILSESLVTIPKIKFFSNCVRCNIGFKKVKGKKYCSKECRKSEK